MVLRKNLKEFMFSKRSSFVFRYTDEEILIITDLILTYLKEFKRVKDKASFKKEALDLHQGCKPTRGGHIIIRDLFNSANSFSTETGKIFKSNPICTDTNLIACISSVLTTDKQAWELVSEYFVPPPKTYMGIL